MSAITTAYGDGKTYEGILNAIMQISQIMHKAPILIANVLILLFKIPPPTKKRFQKETQTNRAFPPSVLTASGSKGSD
jgi:hypothetical protein